MKNQKIIQKILINQKKKLNLINFNLFNNNNLKFQYLTYHPITIVKNKNKIQIKLLFKVTKNTLKKKLIIIINKKINNFYVKIINLVIVTPLLIYPNNNKCKYNNNK